MSKKTDLFDPTMIDSLIKNCKTQEDIMGEGELLKSLKAILESVLQGEMSAHLGYEKNDIKAKNSGNSRKSS